MRGRRNRKYLLESIKVRAAIPIINQYLEQGKKVVVFHQAMKEKENVEPFNFDEKTVKDLMNAEGGKKVLSQLELLKKERPDLGDVGKLKVNGRSGKKHKIQETFS